MYRETTAFKNEYCISENLQSSAQKPNIVNIRSAESHHGGFCDDALESCTWSYHYEIQVKIQN